VADHLGRDPWESSAEFRGNRNGRARKRTVAIGTWAVPVHPPRVSDVPEGTPKFGSQILPPRTRMSMETQRLFARLYLEGLSTGDFEPVFRQLLGETAPLSPNTIVRLKEEWEDEYKGLEDQAAEGRLLRLRLDGWHLHRRRHGEGEELPAHPGRRPIGWNQRADRHGARLSGVGSQLG